MIIEENKGIITIKIEKSLKEKINNKAKEYDKTLSEYIRDTINNELTNDDISTNQSYLSKILDSIIKNIIEEKFNTISQILESLYLKQELIIYLLKSNNDEDFENKINEFTTSYLGDNLRTIL